MRRNLKRNPIQGYKTQKSSHDFSFQHSICNIVRLLNFLALERVPPTKALKHREKEYKKVCGANIFPITLKKTFSRDIDGPRCLVSRAGSLIYSISIYFVLET